MSATAALKGYRTQFLYTLYYILANQEKDYVFRLEGEEDLDVLVESNLTHLIQIKNLSRPVVLSDLISKTKTSFLRRFIERYPTANPILVSFGPISQELLDIKNSGRTFSPYEKAILKRYGLSEAEWENIRGKIRFITVNESDIEEKIISYLKAYRMIDPVPTTDLILYWIQLQAEKRASILPKDIFSQIESSGQYLSERIAISEQYGLIIKPIHQTRTDHADYNQLEKEFYFGSSTRYEHILLELDVIRHDFMTVIKRLFLKSNVVIIKGASGQGKTTLAYRFAKMYAPDSLIYELVLQNNPLLTNQSIQSIIAITKSLDASVFFIINVLPNSTEWMRVVKEFAHYKSVKFLITIRNDDWFKSIGMGVDFLFESIELSLSKNEAAMLYQSLDSQNRILRYIDFEEAWIRFGENVPLLEFVYSITQGDSLETRLRQQLQQVERDAQENGQDTPVEILRLCALSDTFSAKIDISKLYDIPGLKFIIDRFEREYLIKKSEDKKYIIGLHQVRSEVMTRVLFDEVVISKGNYVLKCLRAIEDTDAYYFLLQSFLGNLIKPKDILPLIVDMKDVSWTLYSGILRSLIWVGVRDYVEKNRALFDEIGEAWILRLDVLHGVTFDLSSLLKTFELSKEFELENHELNKRLLPKHIVFKYMSEMMESVPFPKDKPKKPDDWQSLGEVLFWLSNVPNKASKITQISEIDFLQAFQRLDVKRLSKLMLGMTGYSPLLDEVRLKYAKYFLDKFRQQYFAPVVEISREELRINYVVKMSGEWEGSLHDNVIEIVNIMRCAFPDKKIYYTQGHGHRMQLFSYSSDQTTKSISADNLPLEEWVRINAMTRRLYLFPKQPTDWVGFYDQLENWERDTHKLFNELNVGLERYSRGASNIKELLPFLESSYAKDEEVRAPQSITDPFAIFLDRSKEPGLAKDLDQRHQLAEKYDSFFKVLSSLRSSINNFVNQSQKAILARVDKDEQYRPQDVAGEERVSQINLHQAVRTLSTYLPMRQNNFSKFSEGHSCLITPKELIATAFLLKNFLQEKAAGSGVKMPSQGKFDRLLKDFEERINKSCKATSKKGGGEIRFLRSVATEGRPVFLINGSYPIDSFVRFKKVYALVKHAIDEPEYISLKQLMLETYFGKIYFILQVEGYPLVSRWYEIPLYVFRDTEFDSLAHHHMIQKPIEQGVVENLSIMSWRELHPKTLEILEFVEAFTFVYLQVEHLADLRFFDGIELDELGIDMIQEYLKNVLGEVQSNFQVVLDYLTKILVLFPIKEEAFHKKSERLYWDTILEIQKNIFPTYKGNEVNYQVEIDFNIIVTWAEKLHACSESINLLSLLLYDKYIQEFKSGYGLPKTKR